MNFAHILTGQMETFNLVLLMMNIILHLLFSGAVAKDSGNIVKLGQSTCLVSGITWAFATLVGGVFVAGLYWFLHHSTLTRGAR